MATAAQLAAQLNSGRSVLVFLCFIDKEFIETLSISNCHDAQFALENCVFTAENLVIEPKHVYFLLVFIVNNSQFGLLWDEHTVWW